VRAVLTNAHGKTVSSAATLTVTAASCAASPVIETQPSSQTVTEPASASFGVKEGAVPANCSAATIQWELSTNNGTTFTPITNATSATYTINPTSANETGHEVRAVLTNAHGKTVSSAATLTVTALKKESPEAQLRDLLTEVSSSKVAHGIRRELACLLSDAVRNLAEPGHGDRSKCAGGQAARKVGNRSKQSGTCKDLQQFVDTIKADQQRARPKIPAKLATSWSLTANNIEASLGCTNSDGRQASNRSGRHAHGNHRGHRSGHRR
jgi:hypothetical protein